MKILLILVTLCLLLLGACSPDNCNINYVDFTMQTKSPFIHIVRKKEKCNYSVKLDFWVAGKRIESHGNLFFSDNAFHLTIDSLGTRKLKFFDFSKNPKDEYSVFIDFPSNSNYRQIIKVDEIYIRKDGNTVHIFRLKDVFSIGADKSDLVFFVSPSTGIIGSYVSNFRNGAELVISERGDILLNQLDYSKKEFRTIE